MPFEPGGLCPQPLAKLQKQAGLAQAGLADQKDHLPVAVPGPAQSTRAAAVARAHGR